MKKNLFFLLAGFSIINFATAQITITQSDFPTLNSTVRPTNDTVPSASIVVGTAGSGKTWDFSSLKNQNIDTIKFLAPSATAFGNYFPTANYGVLSISNKDTVYVYATKSASQINYIGTVFKYTLPSQTTSKRIFAQFKPAQTLMNFPTSLGTTLNTTSIVEIAVKGSEISAQAASFGVDSAKVIRTIKTYKNVDATGVITTPAFANIDVLRVLIDETDIDDIFIKQSGTWKPLPAMVASFLGIQSTYTTTSKKYQFLANNTYYTLATVSMDTVHNKAAKVEWLYEPVALSLNSISSKLPSIDLMPNPASNKVYVNTTSFKNAEKIELYNQSGQLVLAQDISSGVETIWLETYAPGFYSIMIKNNSGIIIGKNKLVIQ